MRDRYEIANERSAPFGIVIARFLSFIGSKQNL